jgi:Uma2 family endonuclease
VGFVHPASEDGYGDRKARISLTLNDRWGTLMPRQGHIMVQTPTRYITQEAFKQLCLEQPDRVIERTAQGELVEMSPVAMGDVARGLRWGWLVNPQEQPVEIYRTGKAFEGVTMSTVLSGEDILPGFELKV